MYYKTISTTFAALAATVTLICSAPVAKAATITGGLDLSADGINFSPNTVPTTTPPGTIESGQFSGTPVSLITSPAVTVSANSGDISNGQLSSLNSVTIAPTGLTFTDLTFETHFTGGAPTGQGVTIIGSDGTTTSLPVGNGNNPFTFTDTTPLTSITLLTTPAGRSSAISELGFSGLAPIVPPTPEIPLPASFPLFASGLAGMGLLGWRKKRKSTASILAA